MTGTGRKPGYRMQRDGDEFMFVWDAAGIAIGFSQLYESHHELYGQITIESTLPDQPGRLHKSRLNLDAARSRVALVPLLQRRVPSPPGTNIAMPWADMIDIACNKTEESFRAGPPLVNLAQQSGEGKMDYLVRPLVHEESVSILFGDGGVGKSFIAIMLALAVQTGAPLPAGLSVARQANVLYLDWESTPEAQVYRMAALAFGMGIEWPEQLWYRNQQRNLTADAPYLRAEIARREIGFVVIDSLAPAVAGAIREEELPIQTMNAARSLGVGVLALAHVAKASTDLANGAKPTPFGSIMFQNLARATWEVRRAENTPSDTLQVGLYHRKCNYGPIEPRPIGLTMNFTEADGLLSVTPRGFDVRDVTDLTARGNLVYRLQAALREGAKSTTDLKEELGVKEAILRGVLNRRKDLFVRLDSGGGRGQPTTWGLSVLPDGATNLPDGAAEGATGDD